MFNFPTFRTAHFQLQINVRPILGRGAGSLRLTGYHLHSELRIIPIPTKTFQCSIKKSKGIMKLNILLQIVVFVQIENRINLLI